FEQGAPQARTPAVASARAVGRSPAAPVRRSSRSILLEELLPSIDRLFLRRRGAPVGAQRGSLRRPRRRRNQAAESVPLGLQQLVEHLLDPLDLFEEIRPPVACHRGPRSRTECGTCVRGLGSSRSTTCCLLC